MTMRWGKARKTCGFMMESLESRELLSAAVDGVLDPQAASDAVIEADLVQPPLAAPTAINIARTFSTSMIVGWTDESASESGHRVERSIDGQLWTTAGTVGPSVTSFQDTGLTPDTAYYYRVVAFDFLSELPSDAITATTASQGLQLSFNGTGLDTISYNGTTLLNVTASPDDGFFVNDRTIIKPDGTRVVSGAGAFTSSWNSDTHTLTNDYRWGKIVTQYVQDVDRLSLIITVTNKSTTNTLAGQSILPFAMDFPNYPVGYTWESSHLSWNLDGPTVIPADWGSGMVALANDDVVKPLYVGFLSTSPDTLEQQKYLFWVGSTPWWCASPNWPRFDRPIAPGAGDQYVVSLRFGPSGATAEQLAPDVYAASNAQFPYQLNWSDRRPIGSVHVASPGPSISRTNPRGYLGDPALNVLTKAGLRRFRNHLLGAADRSIQVLKEMNAQGMIVWDVEGQQFGALGYVGDPRSLSMLAPEMEFNSAVDAYFKKFTDAGLRVGVTIRGQHIVQTKTGWKQAQSANPYAVMAAKIRYARERWGATLFYIDSNAVFKTAVIYDAKIFKRLQEAFPDVLLIPEHQDTRYYAYTAPWDDLRHGGSQTPDTAKLAYPQAFSVISTLGGDIAANHDNLLNGIRRGDILMFSGWFADPANSAIKAIYDEAFPPAP